MGRKCNWYDFFYQDRGIDNVQETPVTVPTQRGGKLCSVISK